MAYGKIWKPKNTDTPTRSEKGINVYTCLRCKGEIVTVDRHEGTTPFIMNCRATKDCTGEAHSGNYVNFEGRTPEWEWYMPNKVQKKKLSGDVLAYVEMGALMLRRIPWKR